MKVVCIYHSRDLDGWTSAAIVKEKFPDAELIGWDYGDPIPAVVAGSKVIMVDISFPMEDMVHMASVSGWNMTWIDHHKSAIKDYEEFVQGGEAFCNAVLDSNYAACELTSKHFFPDEPIPEAVRLLGRYDCFGHKGTDEEEKVFNFQYGARAIASSPEEARVFLLMDKNEIDGLTEVGEDILNYLSIEAKQLFRDMSFPFEYDGLKGVAINRTRFNPDSFGIDYDEDLCACFHYDGKVWNWSLYSSKIDTSVISKDHGGGGHPGASGFRSKDLKFIGR